MVSIYSGCSNRTNCSSSERVGCCNQYSSRYLMRDCPACGEGKLSPTFSLEPVKYKEIEGTIKVYYSICDNCGSEIAGAEESRKNVSQMKEFKMLVDEGYYI